MFNDKTLWMGDITSGMDAKFVGEAFNKMGEEVKSVKVIYDKYTGDPAGYCFVELSSVDAARRCMLNINGKMIPDSRPPITFRLSFAINPSNPTIEHNLLVGNVPPGVDDALLYNLFGRRYMSCKGAKLFRSQDGTHRGTGIIRFASETEQQQALVEMNRWPMLGRPITLRIAPPRGSRQMPNHSRQYDPVAYYQQFKDHYNSAGWQMYDFYPAQQPPVQTLIMGASASASTIASQGTAPEAHQPVAASPLVIDEELELEDYKNNVDLDTENARIMDASEDFYRSIESSNWFFINSASFHESDLSTPVM